MADQIDLTIGRRESQKVPLTVTFGGVPVDVSGRAAGELNFYIGKAGTTLHTLTVGSGITLTAEANVGKIELDLDSTHTDLERGPYAHELWDEANALNKRKHIIGTLRITDSLGGLA